jgi:hypothetical protein
MAKIAVALLVFFSVQVFANCKVAADQPDWYKQPGCISGHDEKALIAALGRLPAKLAHESRAEYSERLAPHLQKPFSGSVKITDVIALQSFLYGDGDFGGFNSQFDPETSVMSFGFRDAYYFSPETKSAQWSFESKKAGTYIGTNSFGVKKRVQKYTANQVDLILGNVHAQQKFKAVIPAEDKPFFQYTYAVLVGRLVYPLVSFDQGTSEPTVTNPEETQTRFSRLYFQPTEVLVFGAKSKTLILREAFKPLKN